MPVRVRVSGWGGGAGGPRLSRCPKHSFGGIALTQVPVGVGLPEGSGWGLCVTFLQGRGGRKSHHLPRGPPPRPQPGTHLERLASQSCPGSAGGLEASASSGAWDPAELEQVGPIGRDLETKGGWPLAQVHGDLLSRLSQSCSPTTDRYCWLGATAAAPCLEGKGQKGRCPLNLAGLTALDLQPSAQLCSGARHPMCPCDHQGGLVTSPQTAQAGQRRPSGNHVSPRTRSSPLWHRPRPAQHSQIPPVYRQETGDTVGGGEGDRGTRCVHQERGSW